MGNRELVVFYWDPHEDEYYAIVKLELGFGTRYVFLKEKFRWDIRAKGPFD